MDDARIKIPPELFATAESSHFDGELEWETLTTGADDLVFEGPLVWQVDVTNTDGALLVLGNVQARAHATCGRCLGDVELDLDGEIEGWFLISADSLAPEDVGEDELDVLPDDHIVDLAPLIKAALIMDMPNPPLCDPDCAGLCPYCGADLNEGPCGCGGAERAAEEKRASNPFSVLADFDFGE